MVTIIISSTEDPAGTNIKKSLLETTSWTQTNIFFDEPVYKHTTLPHLFMLTIPDRTIFHEHLEKEIQEHLNITPTQAIFISRHRSQTGKPSLSVHPIGNYGTAEFGGKPQTVVPTAPCMMAEQLLNINQELKKTPLTFDVCYEVTHHGPYLTIPTFFTEVGSTEKEWNQQKPADIIAQALLTTLTNYPDEASTPKDIPVLVGIGGGHYAPRFSELVVEKKVAFGHMIPTYQIESGAITPEIIQQACRKTPQCNGVYFHKKALKKSQVSTYKKICEENNIPVISSKELLFRQ